MKEKRPARDRILESADVLFSQKGYGNVGINEIIAHSGSVKATFYHHFESKEQLCEEWLRGRHLKSVEGHKAWLALEPFTTAHLEQYFDTLVEDIKSTDIRGCPFTNTSAFIDSSSEGVREVIQAHKTFQREFFVKIANKLTTPLDPEDFGNILFLLYSGAAMECQNSQSNEPANAAKRGIRAIANLTDECTPQSHDRSG